MGFWDFNKQPTPQPSPAVKQLGADVLEMLAYQVVDIPKMVESTAKDWVLFGQNNRFALDMLDLKNASAIHSSILDSKTNLIVGNGIMFGKTREESNAWLIDNFKSVPFWNKMDKVLYNVTRDQETFGYSCFEIIYSMDRTRIIDISWIDASRIACGKKENGEEIDEYYYSENWKDTIKNPPREICAWDPNGDERRQLMFIKREENNMDYFSLPTYYAAYKWIKADALMSDYNLSAIKNGFSPSIVFKFYKKPTPQERRLNAEMIKGQHGGTQNAGKALIFYADGKELAPDVDTLDATNIDQRLIQVADQIVGQIISAHKAHPALLGIQVPGKLGYSSEMVQSWNVFNAQVIIPERKLIMDAFKQVFMYNGVTNAQIDPIDLGLI